MRRSRGRGSEFGNNALREVPCSLSRRIGRAVYLDGTLWSAAGSGPGWLCAGRKIDFASKTHYFRGGRLLCCS